jgi:uncharacterized protein YbjT (DUF2867 family)
MPPELNVVTGAYGYTGKYITRRLLAAGKTVVTLTGHPDRPNVFGQTVRAIPFHFDDPAALSESLRGATTVYNTYWVRFDHGDATHARSVENTRTLIRSAREAGVPRFVHVSIANADSASPLAYFRGKGLLEEALVASGMSYAIVRPTVIFGREDILINNIAWLLRRFPLFAIPGDGSYRLQPIYVEDMANLVVAAGQRDANETIDAVGPDIFTFDQLVRLIAETVHSKAVLFHAPPALTLLAGQLIGAAVGDVVLTSDEVKGLMAGLLVSDKPPTGQTHLADWLTANSAVVGSRYANELQRHYDRAHP